MDDNQICRFCLDIKISETDPFISPCNCKGSIEYVHLKCLFRWMYGDRLQDPREECNMCNAAYTYCIETLEEPAIPMNRTFYYATSTPVAALPMLLFGGFLTYPSESLICLHSLIATVYLYYISIYTKNHTQYIWYYFKDWSIHALAFVAMFTCINRNTGPAILAFYHCLTCCVWYTTQKVDRSIRISINHRIYKGLLAPS